MDGINHEDLLRCLFDESIDALFICDPHDNRILDVNPKAQRLTEMRRTQLLGMTLPELLRADEGRPFEELIDAYQSTGVFHSEEGHLLTSANGGDLAVSISINRIHTTPTPLDLVVVRDVTKRKRAEAILKSSQERLEILFEHAPIGYYISDLEGIFIDGNRAAERICGYKREEIIGKNFQDLSLISAAQIPKAAALLMKNALGQAAGPAEFVLNRKDGSRIDVELRTFPVQIEGQNLVLSISRDVTEHKRVEEKLRASEQMFRTLAETVPATIAVYQGTCYRYMNPYGEDQTGYSMDELQKMSSLELVHPDFREFVTQRSLARQRGEDVPARYEFKFVTKEGRERWVDFSGTQIQYDGEPAVLGVTVDVTERKRVEEELRRAHDELELRVRQRTVELEEANRQLRREVANRKQTEVLLRRSEQELRLIMDNVPALIVYVDSELRYRFANKQYAEAQGLAPEQIVGRRVQDVVDEIVYRSLSQHIDTALSGQPVEFDLTIEYRTLGTRFVHASYVPDVDNDGEVRGVYVLVSDITERKRADEELAQEHQRLEDLLLAHERDRRLMAYEIHDGLTQYATAALFHFEAFRQRCQALPPRAEAEFEHGLKLVRSTVDEARYLISGLRPPIIDEQGVVASIEFLVAEYARRGGPEFEFLHNGPGERLDALLEGTIYRIAQEAVSNIARHSHAEKARISLNQRNGYLELNVQDWGQGFQVEKTNSARFGLRGIRERAKILGGTASIDSQPGHGTQILVRVPVKYARDSKRPSIA